MAVQQEPQLNAHSRFKLVYTVICVRVMKFKAVRPFSYANIKKNLSAPNWPERWIFGVTDAVWLLIRQLMERRTDRRPQTTLRCELNEEFRWELLQERMI